MAASAAFDQDLSSNTRSFSMDGSAALDRDLSANPLLQDFEFPPYDAVQASHVGPGIRRLLEQLVFDLEKLECTVEPSWPMLVVPFEKIFDRLCVVWGIVNHLKDVKDSVELRAAIEDVQPEVVMFNLRLGQSKPIYNAFCAIRESPDWNTFTDAQKRVVESQIRTAELNGVALEDDKRILFHKIEQELERLSGKFEENIVDAERKFEKLVTKKEDIAGLPLTDLKLAAEKAVSKVSEVRAGPPGPHRQPALNNGFGRRCVPERPSGPSSYVKGPGNGKSPSRTDRPVPF